MQPIKDRDNVHVILLEDGSYWMSGGFSGNRDGIMSTLNLSSATFLPFEDACYKANKLNENGKRCEVIPVLLIVDDWLYVIIVYEANYNDIEPLLNLHKGINSVIGFAYY